MMAPKLNNPTKTIVVNPVAPEPAIIQEAARVIRGGGLVAFPTETVYGLGANALDADAVRKIFAAKGRPASDPLIVHIAAFAQLDDVAEQIPALARELAATFWPGPLTMVLSRRPLVPANVAAGRETVAVRMPAHPVALALCAAAGVPIAAPSANLFSRTSPTEAAHVLEDLAGRIDLLLDGGPTPIGLESTVLDMTESPPALLRPGGVALEQLQRLVPDVVYAPQYAAAHDRAGAPAAPGMLLKHYSPRAELQFFAGPPERVLARMRAVAQQARAAGRSIGIMAPDEEIAAFAGLGVQLAPLGPRDDLAQIGQRIFSSLRELDRHGVEVILVRGFAREGIGLAIWDRLIRAAEGRVIDLDGEPDSG
jgi:L-threonylcarbamoyladenylate synthase